MHAQTKTVQHVGHLACKNCQLQEGPFVSCITVPSLGDIMTECANCHYSGHGQRCSFVLKQQPLTAAAKDGKKGRAPRGPKKRTRRSGSQQCAGGARPRHGISKHAAARGGIGKHACSSRVQRRNYSVLPSCERQHAGSPFGN